MQTLPPDHQRVTGVVHKSEVGVNCWRFEGSNGTGYELRPEQVPAGVLVDGKSLTLVIRPRSDVMSNCMVGQIVDVVSVE